MHVMPIVPKTIEIVEKLNDGFRPAYEVDKDGDPTYFVFLPGEMNEIITYDEYLKRFASHHFTDNAHIDYWIK